MRIGVYVHKCIKGRVLTYIGKIPDTTCTCAAKGLAVDYRRKEGIMERCFRERKCKEMKET